MRANLPLSFKDPNGFIFFKDGQIFRQINPSYKENYDLLMKSGLYNELVGKNFLISHQEIKPGLIKPQLIPFISYPYEWCFSQLQDAALLTLRIMKMALKHGMILKDATSFNVQFLNGKPIFIDTLSFEKYVNGKPWVAYRQFCEQFLAPLAVAGYTDIRLNQFLKSYLGSLPLDLAVKLLPIKAKINPSIFMHLFLQAKVQMKKSNSVNNHSQFLSRQSLVNILDNLENTIKNLEWKLPETLWKNYQENNPSYTDGSLKEKRETVEKFLKSIKPKNVWDLGANLGEYSRLAAAEGANVISMDADPTVVEKNYLHVKQKAETNLLPLWIDLMNPTPALGWENQEREAMLERMLPDTVLALALIHHLTIANNLPLPMLAKFFSKTCQNLVIEFIPKEDFQVQELLINREDIFPAYNQTDFEKIFSEYFLIKEKKPLIDSKRIVYLMKKNEKN